MDKTKTSSEDFHRSRFLYHVQRWCSSGGADTLAEEDAYSLLGHLGYMDRFSKKHREFTGSRLVESAAVAAIASFLPAAGIVGLFHPFIPFNLSALIRRLLSHGTSEDNSGHMSSSDALRLRQLAIQACSHARKMNLAESARELMHKGSLTNETVIGQFVELAERRDFLDCVLTKAYLLCQGMIDAGDKDLLSELSIASQSVSEFDALMDEEFQEIPSEIAQRMEPSFRAFSRKPSRSSSWWFYKHYELKSQRVPDDWCPKNAPSNGLRTLITLAASLVRRRGRIVLDHGEIQVFPLPPNIEGQAIALSQVFLWESVEGFPGVVPDSPVSHEVAALNPVYAKLTAPVTKHEGRVHAQWAVLGDIGRFHPEAFFYAVERKTGVIIGEGNLNRTCDRATLSDGSWERMMVGRGSLNGIALVVLQQA